MSNAHITEPLDLQIDFPSPAIQKIQTESIKYTGSKAKLIPQILDIVKDLEVKKIWDAFSGSTRVSQAFAQAGYEVESNRSEEHTSELQSRFDLVCRLLL